MSTKNRRIKIWFCEDDETLWKSQREHILEIFPKASVKHFPNAGYAAQSSGSPEYIIVDVGGACGLGCNVVSLTRYNVEGLAEKHPGAIFIITSALGFYAQEVYDELMEEIKAISRFTENYGVEEICDVIKEYE